MGLTAAVTHAIIPAILPARPAHQPITPEAVAGQPVTDVAQRLVITLTNPAARLIAMKPDVPAELTPVPMGAVVQEDVVLLVLIQNQHLLLPVEDLELAPVAAETAALAINHVQQNLPA